MWLKLFYSTGDFNRLVPLHQCSERIIGNGGPMLFEYSIPSLFKYKPHSFASLKIGYHFENGRFAFL